MTREREIFPKIKIRGTLLEDENQDDSMPGSKRGILWQTGGNPGTEGYINGPRKRREGEMAAKMLFITNKGITRERRLLCI